MATERIDLTTLYTPAEIAKSRGVNVSKVITWINSGELKAVNYATKRGGMPRWKISAAALEEFERSRQSGPVRPPVVRRRKAPEFAEDFFPDK